MLIITCVVIVQVHTIGGGGIDAARSHCPIKTNVAHAIHLQSVLHLPSKSAVFKQC